MTAAILSLILALTLGAMSPGPSFIMVARTALAASRPAGLAAAAGMGAGGVIFALIALLGLLALLETVPVLYLAVKVLGGLYLLHLAWRIWRGAREPLAIDEAARQNGEHSPGRAFVRALATQLSNPKTAVAYASIFASLLPADAPSAFLVALPFIVFVIETAWYSIVALVLSAPAPRARYLAAKTAVDRAAAAVMGLLGLKLMWMAHEST